MKFIRKNAEKVALFYVVATIVAVFMANPVYYQTDRSLFTRFMAQFGNMKIEQTGNLTYLNPVQERRLTADPADSVVRLRPDNYSSPFRVTSAR